MLIFLLLTGTYAQARSKKQVVLKTAKSLYSQKKYVQSIKLIAKYYSIKRTNKMPTSLLYLLALNFQKVNRHTNAIYFFNQLIKHHFLRKHIEVLKAYKREEVYDVDIPKILNSIYFHQALSYYALYNKTNRTGNADKAVQYFTICDEVGFNNSCDDYIENINQKKEYAIKSIDNFEFFISAGTLVFQDSLNLKNEANGEDNDILANNSTICYGAGLRYGNAFRGYFASGCIFSGTATVEEAESSTVSYKQAGVPVAGVLSEVGYYIKPFSEKTRLGLSIPVMLRNGSYQEPSGYSFENKSQTSYGLSLNSSWEISFFELQFKLANLQKTNLFAIQGLVNF